MSAAGESGLCIVIATLRQGQRIAGLDDMLVETTPEPLAVALAPLLGRRGRSQCECYCSRDQCPHSAEGDMRALNEGTGFDPKCDIGEHLVLQ
jgi:hypothetical protein